MGPLQRPPGTAPTAFSQDPPWLRRRERISLVKNRMREICTSGSVRDGDGNAPIYSAFDLAQWGEEGLEGCRLCRPQRERTSHDEGLVKGSHHGNIETSPVASVSKVQAHLRDAARFRARSTSHAVAAHSSCTKIPLSAGRAQEDENHSRKRHFRPWLATVRLPGSARNRSWEMTG